MLSEGHLRSQGTAYVSPRGSFSNSELYRTSLSQTDRAAADQHESAMTDVDLGEPRPSTPPAGRSSSTHQQHRSPFTQHSRQHSTPTFPIPQSAPRSPSPLRSHLSFSNNDMPYTGDGQGSRQLDTQAGGFGGWLRRSSTPSVQDTPLSPDTTPKSVRTSVLSTGPAKSTPQSKLGLFASSVTAFANRLGNQAPAHSIDIDDELYNMDVEAALFPAPMSPSERDTFSPSAYKNLQANAVGISLKMQNAYRQQTLALHEVQSERDAQREEIEEARLRIALFKTQLEEMATKAAEQEQEMRRLVDELRAEKKHDRHEAENRSNIASSVVSEDLGIDDERDRRRWRESSGTASSATETDADSGLDEGESVFSRSRSPTIMTSITENNEKPPATVTSRPASLHVPAPKTQLPRQLSTFQRIVKGIAEGSSDGCRNCKGQDSSTAWNTVSVLRDENKDLKQRVVQLEVAVEGALDLVNGIGLR
ncbi:hypothetical protein Micbo1qcDRAFT_159420 [Microdochium bolleyi]|uniref:Uncharacterized protein n=1 Tax=Microdochium bolleyi TaxID=196109 RepID=A0A136JAW1_9PEZI|nr:hypothetical protein Micbo1qcDRAFT_159420 [Microdochium bolleyi]